MNRATSAALLLAAVVAVQVAVVNRLPLPWGTAPDLVVLTVTAVAARTSPAVGAAAGFLAGAAVDAAPPADHELGRYAIALCVAGYVVGARHGPAAAGPRLLGAALLATVLTCLGFACTGLLVGDPRITAGAVASELVTTLLLTAAAAPAVVYPVARMLRTPPDSDFAAIGGTAWPGRGRH